MKDSSDNVPRQQTTIGDLPDEVFVLILMLLPFPDQVRVRGVSTYWKTAVHFVFGKQEKVRISLQDEEEYEMDVRDWELRSLGFNFDSGINIVIKHPETFRRDSPECPIKEQAVTRFCNAVEFAILHFDGIRIAEISWGFQHYMDDNTSSKYRRHFVARSFKEQDRDRMDDVSNRFALRFQDQLLCFVSPLFDLTPDYHFPVLKHLTLLSVSHEIRNMFETVTPKLVSLLVDSEFYDRDDIHPDNFQHLPADFRCISLPYITNYETPVHLLRCQKAIQSIRWSGYPSELMNNYPIRFANLRCLQIRVNDYEIKGNHLLTVNAAGLQHLLLKWKSETTFRRFPPQVMLPNLKTLVVDCNCDTLLDILSRTSHRLEQLIVTWCYGLDGRNLFSKLSEIKFLTIIKIRFCFPSGPDPEPSFTDSVLMLLRGASRSTLKHFKFASYSCIDVQIEEIATELRLMQKTESLESGIVEGPQCNARLEL